MSAEENEKTRESVPLAAAWEHFAALSEKALAIRDHRREIMRSLSNCEADQRVLLEREAAQMRLCLENWLVALLRAGDLIAYGRRYGLPKDAPSTRVYPAQFEGLAIDAAINWEASAIRLQGITLVDVEVALPHKEAAPKSRDVKKRGRPSSDKIDPAVEVLAADPTFAELKRVEQINRVREHIFGSNVNHVKPPKGYGDGAIKKRLLKRLPSQSHKFGS